ncbi:MAG: energy-coupling factor ABC transporter ATP-binding protein [Clostridiales Family XIII bacterium]|jgi:energy-coupling factor transport system ATP-binding protein|nr:energy-coupling factor ABC transporter ATP-binding protein [Clostridiales Family XIII bacterium]
MALIIENLSFSYAPTGTPLAHSGGRSRKRQGDGDLRGKSPVMPGAPLFNDFSAEFPRGAITAVTGPNGSGKTTLARLLVGILKPSSGDVYIDGESVRGMTLTEVGGRVGYVMQDTGRQIFKTTVADEMLFGLHNIGMAEDDAAKLTDEYLEMFGLSDRKEDFPFAMSTGERQRLVLAAVLAMKPSYLILDEPTSSLDPGRRSILGKYLSATRAKDDIGIALISHDKKFVTNYADAVIDLSSVSGQCGGTKENVGVFFTQPDDSSALHTPPDTDPGGKQ